MTTLAEDTELSSLPARYGIRTVPLSDSFERSAQADLVIANTAVTAGWVTEYLKMHPEGGRSLIWWVDEIDVQVYAERMHSLRDATVAIFDSHAALENWKRGSVAPGWH